MLRIDTYTIPYIIFQSMVVNVPENLGPNKVVGQVHATDLDSGMYGEVWYSMSNQNKEDVKELFKVGSESGTITLKKSLDHEAHDER